MLITIYDASVPSDLLSTGSEQVKYSVFDSVVTPCIYI